MSIQVSSEALPQSGMGGRRPVAEPLDLGALASGNEQEWTRAFRCLWPIALNAARHPSMCLNACEAEEAANEALAQLVSQVGRVSSIDELKAFTAAIALRKAVSLARRNSALKRGHALQSELSSGEAEYLGALAPSTEYAASELERAEMILLLHRALLSVDDETRALLEEKIIHGYSYEELATRHAKPLGTVCAKVARGLAKLRRALNESPDLAKELRGFLR